MRRRHDKLVRDRIPQTIRENGDEAVTHAADQEEFRTKLLDKLREEAKEFAEHPCAEEMADVQEVIDAIFDVFNFSREEVRDVQRRKREERGGFDKRIILDETSEA